jgi:hypothetical protein
MSLEHITRKRKWSEAEERQVVDGWRRSGLSPADFARRHGLAEVRLLRWRARLAERVAPADPVMAAFFPVKICDEIMRSRGSFGGGAGDPHTRALVIEDLIGDHVAFGSVEEGVPVEEGRQREGVPVDPERPKTEARSCYAPSGA